MVLDIAYPKNSTDWFAKGKLDNGIYFEIPAVFNEDGTCDIAATDERVQQFIKSLETEL